MGRAIFYCVQCSKRVSDADIETGKAFRVGDQIFCAACAPASARTTTSKRMPAVTRPRSGGTSVGMKSVSAPLATPPPAPSEEPAFDRRKALLIGGAAAAAIVIVVLLVVLLRGKGNASGNPAPLPDDGRNAAGKTENVDPKEAAAREDLEKARAFAKANPDDLAGRQKQFTDLVWKWEGTDTGREAAKEAGAVKAVILEKVSGWMAELEAKTKDLVEAKDFFGAARTVEGAMQTHDLTEWRLAVERLASDLRGKGKKIADEEEAKKALIEKSVPIEDKSAPKPLSEEAKGYLAKWESAVAKATARDFAGAIADVEGAAAPLKEADVKAEAAADAALLRRAATVVKESTDYLRQRPRGGGISLNYRDGVAGTIKRAGGMILQIDAERVEIRSGKESVFVDWSDVTAATLAEVAQRGQFDPKSLAVLCLLEGDAASARGFKADLPAKWWTYGEGARLRIPKPDSAERSARDLFAAAEKGYRSMETRAAAIDGYRSLRTDYGSSALVRTYSERIFRRSDAGKEYYYSPADFHIEGTFRLAKSGKIESVKDSDDRDTLLNVADIEFAVLPGQTYRCWIQVGACCEETFLFFLQGTELTDVDPKTKKKIACEPGSNFAVPVKHSIRNLKKTHQDHKPKGASVHPKTAARWEWVEVVLPKYAGPGGKKLRFMTNQAGFSIGGAIVTSVRKTWPPEAEIKELEKARALDEPPMPIDPDLIGWWTFDEGGGAEAVDLSGKGHPGKLVGGAKWVDGKIGGAVESAGAKSGVEIADAEDLRITGDLTMSIWVKKNAEASDWICIFGRGLWDKRNYGLWLEAGTKRYMYQQYSGSNDINVYGLKRVETGKWTHLAATIEGDLVKVYFNGELDASARRPGKPWAQAGPLGLSYALGHTGLTGAIDDARLYRRALAADEIKALSDQGK